MSTPLCKLCYSVLPAQHRENGFCLCCEKVFPTDAMKVLAGVDSKTFPPFVLDIQRGMGWGYIRAKIAQDEIKKMKLKEENEKSSTS